MRSKRDHRGSSPPPPEGEEDDPPLLSSLRSVSLVALEDLVVSVEKPESMRFLSPVDSENFGHMAPLVILVVVVLPLLVICGWQDVEERFVVLSLHQIGLGTMWVGREDGSGGPLGVPGRPNGVDWTAADS